MLKIALKKVSLTHHAFTLLFDGGGKETIQLETKTYLYHDLLHFAVESEAKLTDSFYGRLLKGYRYEDLALPEMAVLASAGEHEVLSTERVVGVMTGVLKSGATPEQAVGALNNLLGASGDEMPNWFTPEFVTSVQERMRQLLGEWNGTPLGETMTLEFGISRTV